MVKSKRILSVILAVVMVLTVIPMGTFAFAADVQPVAETSSTSINNKDGKLVVPVVTLTSTPVFRVAASAGSQLGGNVLVNATDSGLPEISGSYQSQFYAGETPHGYEVVFTTDLALDGTPSLGCDVPGIAIGDVSKSGNTYTWVVSGGSSSMTAGDYIHFTVGYQFKYHDQLTDKDVTKSYTVKTSSHVENVTNGAAMMVDMERTGSTHEHPVDRTLHRILGANTYTSFGNTENSTAYTQGYHNMTSNSWVNDSSAYTKGSQYKSDSSGDGNDYWGSGTDRVSVATTYVDRGDDDNVTPINIANNLRLSVFFANNNSKGFEYRVVGSGAKSGIELLGGVDVPHDNTAEAQLGLTPITSNVVVNGPGDHNGYGEYCQDMTGNGYATGATKADNGNLVNTYTVYSRAGVWYKKSDRVRYDTVNFILNIASYNKSELRGFVDELISSDMNEEASTATNSGIGINPQQSWYKAGFDSYNSALTAATEILAKPDTNQDEIDLAYSNLENAVSGLEVAKANTTALDEAIAAFAALKSGDYIPAKWNEAKAYYTAAQTAADYSVFYQCAVDKAAADLVAATAKLKSEGVAAADWDALDELLDAYEGYKAVSSHFTTDSWGALVDAVNYAIDKRENGNYNKNQQSTVDGIILAVANALKYPAGPEGGLVDALADYTAFDAQVSRYNNETLVEKARIEKALADSYVDLAALGITNIYTDTSWNRVQANLNIDRDYTWKDQDIVDDAADALDLALTNLALKDAVYDGVNAAKQAASSKTKEWYTTDSWANLQAAVRAVKTGYKIDRQAEVNAMATAINVAILGLVEADADYSTYNDYVTQAQGLTKAYYTEESYNAVFTAINGVKTGYKKQDQSTLDAEVALVKSALDALVMFDANYDAVDTAIARWNGMTNKTDYTDASVALVTGAINNVVRGKKIDEQSAVDAMASAIDSAIDGLVLKGADYTALEAAFNQAKTIVSTQNSFANSHNGYSYYTPAKYTAFTEALAAVPVNEDGSLKKDKPISEQETVTGYATALSGAITALTLNVADYSALETAMARVPSDQDLETLYTEESATAVAIAAVDGAAALETKNLTTDKQADVDALAKAVNDAVDALVEAGLDLTNYNKVVAKMPNDRTVYTAASLKAMDDAKSAADLFKSMNNKISKQTEFETYVTALDTKITALEFLDANYALVDKAIQDANAEIDKGIYTVGSVAAVTAAISAVVRGKKINEQTAVDNMAAAINEAVSNLEERPLDKTTYNAVVVPQDLDLRVEAKVTAFNAAKKAADDFAAVNKYSKQAQFETLVAAYAAAAKDLPYKPADYTELDNLISYHDSLDPDNYENYFDIYFEITSPFLEETVPANRGLDIRYQNTVDELVGELEFIISMYELKGADYTEVNAKVQEANTAIATKYYTENSVAALQLILDGIDYTKDIEHQNEVDAYVGQIDNGIKALVMLDANYTELDKLITYVETLSENGGIEEDGTEYVNFFDIYFGYIDGFLTEVESHRGLKINKQSEVDGLVAELQGYIDMFDTGDEPPVESFSFVSDETHNATYKEVDGVKYAYGFTLKLAKKNVDAYFDCENVHVEIDYSNSRYLGTGSVIHVISDATGEEIDSYVVVIYGDVDGNGSVTTDDADLIYDQYFGTDAELSYESKLAGNVSGSKKRITLDTDDVDALKAVDFGSCYIDQLTGDVIEY